MTHDLEAHMLRRHAARRTPGATMFFDPQEKARRRAALCAEILDAPDTQSALLRVLQDVFPSGQGETLSYHVCVGIPHAVVCVTVWAHDPKNPSRGRWMHTLAGIDPADLRSAVISVARCLAVAMRDNLSTFTITLED